MYDKMKKFIGKSRPSYARLNKNKRRKTLKKGRRQLNNIIREAKRSHILTLKLSECFFFEKIEQNNDEKWALSCMRSK